MGEIAPEYQSFIGFKKKQVNNKMEEYLEQLDRNGFFIVEDLFIKSELETIREKMDLIWEKQLQKYGEKLLTSIGDYGVARAMMEENELFMNLIIEDRIFQFVKATVGDTAILHLQNGILLFPSLNHNQAKYHKDFPKPFISSKILSINTFILVDDFTEKNGGTWIVPGSHKYVELPSDQYLKQNQIQIKGKAGSVIIFDSMLWHKGGRNKSGKVRRAINQQYTKPFIKQQLDYPSFLKRKIEMESKLAQTLGMWTLPPKCLDDYRVLDPKLRSYRGGQG